MTTSPIRSTYDTFLHFLSDNLAGIPVHPIRKDPNDSASSVFQMNALNVAVIKAVPNVHIGILQLSLDVINDSELQVIDWVDAIWALLMSACYTLRVDYTDPNNPALTGSRIYWKASASFSQVYSDHYAHYTCKVTINNSHYN